MRMTRSMCGHHHHDSPFQLVPTVLQEPRPWGRRLQGCEGGLGLHAPSLLMQTRGWWKGRAKRAMWGGGWEIAI